MDSNIRGPEGSVGRLSADNESIADLLRRVGDDLKAIAKDEAALAKREIGESLKAAGIDLGAAILGGIVALIGFALLCTTAVLVLEPLIEPLWLRMLIMSVVYLLVGGAVAGIFIKRAKEELPPTADRASAEAKRTIGSLKGVRHA